MFFNIYFGNYVKYQTATFQKEMFAITEDKNIKLAVIVAFRGSGKSTIMTLSYPLWAILGEQQKKFVLILSQTQRQARQHLINLRRELESNELLRSDLGPFKEEDEWGSLSLVIPKYNARIMAASTEQSVRGLRHGAHRPDLILCDDIEDLESVKTKEGRDKTHQWLTGDVVPSGDQETRVIVVGNLLHEDSVLMRLKDGIEQKLLDGVFKSYPLLNSSGVVAWIGKYPNNETIQALQRTIGNEISWHREYLLHIISNSDRVVHPEWIHTYKHEDELPTDDKLVAIYVGVDLASSQSTSADFTSMVTLKIYHVGEKKKAYVMPHPFNARIEFPDQVKEIKALRESLRGQMYPKIHIEKVSYQAVLGQQLEHDGIKVEMVPVHGDKRDRLAMTTAAIKEGLVVFPDKGIEELRMQLTGFGVEKHNDLADAFSLVVNQFITFCNQPSPSITWITINRPRRRGLSNWSDDDYDDD
jgi:predicted phage terminase large subunit-like protein